MNLQNFEKNFNEVWDKSQEILIRKGKEYTRGNDRLSNFKQAAMLRNNETPEGALIGMLAKHWVSIADMVDDIKTGKLASLSQWDEKLLDNINYSILLRGLIIERGGVTERKPIICNESSLVAFGAEKKS